VRSGLSNSGHLRWLHLACHHGNGNIWNRFEKYEDNFALVLLLELTRPIEHENVDNKEEPSWIFHPALCGGWPGLCVTIVPLLATGIFGRKVWKLNTMILSGLLAGNMTNPPALAFANTSSRSGAPTVTYATVYPITMLLRIRRAQILTPALSE
jgi:hypothetical protein